MMKDFIKFALKASVGLFILGVGTKLGKDAISDLRQFNDDRKNLRNGEHR